MTEIYFKKMDFLKNYMDVLLLLIGFRSICSYFSITMEKMNILREQKQ